MHERVRRISEPDDRHHVVVEPTTPVGEKLPTDTIFTMVNPRDDVVYSVVLDLSMAAFIDSVGLRALEQLADDLRKVHVGLFLVQNKGTRHCSILINTG